MKASFTKSPGMSQLQQVYVTNRKKLTQDKFICNLQN